MKLVPIEENGCVSLAADDSTSSVAFITEQLVALYRRRGFTVPWIGYLAEEGGAWVGTCGFAGPPGNGEVEIAYFTFPGGEGRGIATRMVAQLIAKTRASVAQAGLAYIAHTLPEEGASTRILRRHGFELLGPIDHPEDGVVWKWRMTP